MFKQIAKHFGVGLMTVLPFGLVIWVLVWVFDQVDGLFGPWIDQLTGVHVPGIGFVLVIVGLTFIGAMAQLYVSHQIFHFVERIFQRIPLVKSLYAMFKELIQNLFDRRRGFKQVVLVNWPDERAQVLGFVTQANLPSGLDATGDRIAVYLPNAFQFAGITAIVEKSRVTFLDMSVEEAFRFSLSAGLGQGPSAVPEVVPTPRADTVSSD